MKKSVPAITFFWALVTGCGVAAAQQFAPTQPLPKTEDTMTLCPVITPELHSKIGELGKSMCRTNCRGCGCKGGPGYRGPSKADGAKGACVSYANIIQICGPPPHSNCVRECGIVRPGCIGQGRVWLKTLAASFGIIVAFVPSQLPPPDDEGVDAAEEGGSSSTDPKLLPR